MERPRRLPSGSCKTTGKKPNWPNTLDDDGNAGRGSCRPWFRPRNVVVVVVEPTGEAGTGLRRPGRMNVMAERRMMKMMNFPGKNKRPSQR